MFYSACDQTTRGNAKNGQIDHSAAGVGGLWPDPQLLRLWLQDWSQVQYDYDMNERARTVRQ